ncbi:hypothetical protein HN51_061149 [Arachis hypogaea]|uniref:Uncharacterized protein n=1 Tax=Arachis hypogaea TaxID=3818 RepID=A0A445AMD8_ARAHY|nr:uncharacterized protein DS421_11g319610 [Arachis hypogaea]RYR27524.1 hypothetical protein Ahy_B01g051543 [Arachis hypogaea]
MRLLLVWVQQLMKQVWRTTLSVASTVVGFLCFALSSSFKDLFGEWNSPKIVVYTVVGLTVLLFVLYAKELHLIIIRKKFMAVRAHVGFLVFASTTVYSFFFDKATKGKPDAYSLVSYVAFATMSFTSGFIEFLYFFAAILISQLMKINVLLGLVGLGFSYVLIIVADYTIVKPEDHHITKPIKYFFVIQPTKIEVWRLIGLVSSVVGLLCYALGSTSKYLFQEWNSFKIIIYTLFSLMIFLLAFLAKGGSFLRILRLGANMATFLVLALILPGVYSFFDSDAKVRMRSNAYDIISCGAFHVMSLSFSRQIPCSIFGTIIVYFFAGALIIELMEIKLFLGIVGISFCYLLWVLGTFMDKLPEYIEKEVSPVVNIEIASRHHSNELPEATMVEECLESNAADDEHSDHSDHIVQPSLQAGETSVTVGVEEAFSKIQDLL